MSFSLDISDIRIFKVNYSLTRGAGATVELNNDHLNYSPGKYSSDPPHGKIVTLQIVQDETTYTLFKGKVTRMKPTYTMFGENGCSMSLVSVFDGLDDLPVNTETFGNDDDGGEIGGGELMERLLTDYGGISSEWLNLPFDDNGVTFSNVVVNDDSLIKVIRQIADACDVELFVNRNGALTTALKKDVSSPVDFLLEKKYMEESTISEDDRKGFEISVVKVRGKFKTELNEGPQTIVEKQMALIYTNIEGKAYYKIEPNIKNDQGEMEKLAVNKEEALNSEVIVYNGADSGKVIGLDGNQLVIEFEGRFSAKFPQYVQFEVKTYLDFEVSQEDDKINSIGISKNVVNDEEGYYYESYDRSGRNAQIVSGKNERQRSRIEVTVKDEELVDTIGVRYGEYENPYIRDEDFAERKANRVLKEEKMKNYKVNGVQTPWLPELDTPGKKVTIPLGTTTMTVDCLLSDLQVDFDGERGTLKSSYSFVKVF